MPASLDSGPAHDLAQRVRFVAVAMLLIMSAGWVGWFFPFDDLLDRSGTPLGADFAMFYVAGQVVWDGAGEQLYDQAAHQQRLQALFPALDPRFALPYRYPPCVAAMFAPLAALPYPVAYGLFALLTCGAWWMCARILLQELPAATPWRTAIGWALLGWPVAWETLIGGQASMLALLIVTLTYVSLKNHRIVVAGAVLAIACYKPNVLALFGLACLLRYPGMLRGFVPMGGVCLVLCLVPAGWQGLLDYRHLTASLALESWDVATPAWKVHGLAPWIEMWLPGAGRAGCWIAGAATAIFLATRFRFPARQGASLTPLWFATLLMLNAVFNAYTPIYDLVLLMPAAVLTIGYLLTRSEFRQAPRVSGFYLLLGGLACGPHLSQALAKASGLQLSAFALLAVLAWQTWMLWRDRDLAGQVDQFGDCSPGAAPVSR